MSKKKGGSTKQSILAELGADTIKYEQRAKNIKMRYAGARPKDAPMPILSTDIKVKKEVAEVQESAGVWNAPKRLYKPKWSEDLGISNRRLAKSSGKIEDCVNIFSPDMPPRSDVLQVKTQHITRTSNRADTQNTEEMAPNDDAYEDTLADNTSSVSCPRDSQRGRAEDPNADTLKKKIIRGSRVKRYGRMPLMLLRRTTNTVVKEISRQRASSVCSRHRYLRPAVLRARENL